MSRLHLLGTAAALLMTTAIGGQASAGDAAFPYTNRLAQSADPYLLLHAHNPVDWYPWGPEAFAKAKAEGKPIFLSVGYSTCYWCHVAEKQIYSNPAIAALMNRWFVNVTVDREQRPDVDKLYIVATEILTEHGAWPNNLFLTPDGKPFYAGSYFPPKDDGDTPGFPKVLAAIHDLWENHRVDKVEPAAADVYQALEKVAAAQAAKPVAVAPDRWLRQASAGLLKSVDPVNGGLGAPTSGPKFPQAPALDLLLAAANVDHDAAARDALAKTLDAMAYGGIHDQLGGGFHRYATEPTWTIPHFEKMLSDNAQLLAIYARAHALTKAPLDADIARDTAGYLLRDMQAPTGGFYTAQDAEIGGIEGADYLWTRADIEAALGQGGAEKFLAVYEIAAMADAAPFGDPNAEVPHGGVLRVRLPIDATLKRAGAPDPAAMLATLAPERAKLLAVRRARKQPATDEKIVTGLNGLAIGALARAGADLAAPDLTQAGSKAASRLWTEAFDAKTQLLHHEIIDKAEVDGYLEDYAMLGGGLLDLAAATKDDAWRARAAMLADAMLARFARPDGKLGAGDGLIVTLGDDADTDVPSGTSAALALLSRLGQAPGGERFEAAAARLAVATSGQIAARPTAWPSAIAALARDPITPSSLAAAAPKVPVAVASTAPVLPTVGVPSTADHVHVSARVEGDAIAVTLRVDPGYHVNAHKPSLDYLVPTDLAFAGLKPDAIDYPIAVRFKPSFAKDALDVYQGDVPVTARFAPGALSGVMAVDGTLTAQACDDKTCLPQASLPVEAANSGR